MKVEPIRDRQKIEDIKKLLSGEPRNYCLFISGINNGLRAGDLLSLKVYQVKNKKIGDYTQIKEEKTGKINYFYINKTIKKSIDNLIKTYNLSDNDYLFPSRKGKEKMTTYTVNRLVKNWTKSVGLQGNYGSHSLRKTWGYQQRANFGVSWELISKRYNHSNPAETRVYLGISDTEITNICLNNEI